MAYLAKLPRVFSDPKGKPARRFVELSDRLAAISERGHTLDAEYQRAQVRVRQLDEALGAALEKEGAGFDGSVPRGGEAEKVHRELARARSIVEGPWQARANAIRADHRNAERELHAHVAAHRDDLAGELRDLETRARAELTERLRAADEARERWRRAGEALHDLAVMLHAGNRSALHSPSPPQHLAAVLTCDLPALVPAAFADEYEDAA